MTTETVKTKKRLNISGNVELVEDVQVDDLIAKLKNNDNVDNVSIDKKNKSNKFKLGYEKRDVSFDIYVENKTINVLLTIHLGLDKSKILSIETFSGGGSFINVDDYESELVNALKQSTDSKVFYEFSITGFSSSMK